MSTTTKMANVQRFKFSNIHVCSVNFQKNNIISKLLNFNIPIFQNVQTFKFQYFKKQHTQLQNFKRSKTQIKSSKFHILLCFFKISNFQIFKISRFQKFKMSKCKIFKFSNFHNFKMSISNFQHFKLSNFKFSKKNKKNIFSFFPIYPPP